MKHPRHALALLALPALLAFTLPGDTIAFGVKAKTKLDKSFESKLSMVTHDVKMFFDGEEAPAEAIDGFELTVGETENVEVHDEYLAVGDGRPTKLKRTFAKLTGGSTQHVKLPESAPTDEKDQDESKTKKSALEGKTVLFTWDPKAEQFDKEFDAENGDAELLEKLEEDMDFRELLPTEALAEGKSWNIEAKAFNGLVGMPGGNLHLDSEKGDDEDDDGPGDEMGEAFEKNIRGKGTGTYKGQRDVDGHRCAVIALKADLKTHGEETKKSKRGEVQTTMKLDFALEGEVLWDLDAGHFRKVDAQSKVTLAMVSETAMDFGGSQHSMKQEFGFEGEFEFSGSAE